MSRRAEEGGEAGPALVTTASRATSPLRPQQRPPQPALHNSYLRS